MSDVHFVIVDLTGITRIAGVTELCIGRLKAGGNAVFLLNVVKDDTFVETDAETKAIIVDKLNTGLSELYLFAGKYYMTHEFNYVPTKSELLVTIINECLARGFYFGEDEVLRREGII